MRGGISGIGIIEQIVALRIPRQVDLEESSAGIVGALSGPAGEMDAAANGGLHLRPGPMLIAWEKRIVCNREHTRKRGRLHLAHKQQVCIQHENASIWAGAAEKAAQEYRVQYIGSNDADEICTFAAKGRADAQHGGVLRCGSLPLGEIGHTVLSDAR